MDLGVSEGHELLHSGAARFGKQQAVHLYFAEPAPLLVLFQFRCPLRGTRHISCWPLLALQWTHSIKEGTEHEAGMLTVARFVCKPMGGATSKGTEHAAGTLDVAGFVCEPIDAATSQALSTVITAPLSDDAGLVESNSFS